MQRRVSGGLFLLSVAAPSGCAAPSQLAEPRPVKPVAVAAAPVAEPEAVKPRRALDYVTIDVEDEPLAEVVKRISRQSRRNIIVEPGARSLVTLSLEHIHWADAIDLIAR